MFRCGNKQKKLRRFAEFLFLKSSAQNYLEDFFALEEDFAELADFLELLDFLAAQDLLLEEAFLLQEDLLQLLESCSTARDQKYSFWPFGQPAFCQR